MIDWRWPRRGAVPWHVGERRNGRPRAYLLPTDLEERHPRHRITTLLTDIYDILAQMETRTVDPVVAGSSPVAPAICVSRSSRPQLPHCREWSALRFSSAVPSPPGTALDRAAARLDWVRWRSRHRTGRSAGGASDTRIEEQEEALVRQRLLNSRDHGQPSPGPGALSQRRLP